MPTHIVGTLEKIGVTDRDITVMTRDITARHQIITIQNHHPPGGKLHFSTFFLTLIKYLNEVYLAEENCDPLLMILTILSTQYYLARQAFGSQTFYLTF